MIETVLRDAAMLRDMARLPHPPGGWNI